MNIYDISMGINTEIQVYKNNPDKKPLIKVVSDYSTGDIYESRLTLDMHTGTHIDAPLHVTEGGQTVENIDISKLITKCRVIDMSKATTDSISENALVSSDIQEGEFILFKTKNSFTDAFLFDFTFLDISGAQFLKNKMVKGIGIDSLGIERAQSGHPTHKLLLESDIIILEGLRLAQIQAGEYILIALPLKVEGTEACPVRAILIEGNSFDIDDIQKL